MKLDYWIGGERTRVENVLSFHFDATSRRLEFWTHDHGIPNPVVIVWEVSFVSAGR